jgi:hypothetical protein
MDLHFANLKDEDVKDLVAGGMVLRAGLVEWIPKCCFPAIGNDVLLYLAILGGKEFPSYMDSTKKNFSTSRIFNETKQLSIDENTNAPSNDGKWFENMVAHAIFSASRRNGVKGIHFDDFFACLIGEFQHEEWKRMTLHLCDTSNGGKRDIVASDLLKKCENGVSSLSERTIPFLAPPNAEWPSFIIEANGNDCKFGHLIRAFNKQRCDIYVQDLEKPKNLCECKIGKKEKAIFLCECKYWNEKVHMNEMNKIIGGLNVRWEWSVALVFCPELAIPRSDWENTSIGCVRVDCKEGDVKWVSQPADHRQKLIFVIETGVCRRG